MKQGRATHSGSASTKVEPRSQGINPAAVAQLGTHVGNHVTDGHTAGNPVETMYEGRGLKAPMVGKTSHKAGSQGRHG